MVMAAIRMVIPYVVMFIAAYSATSLVFASKLRKGKVHPAIKAAANRDTIGVMDKILVIECIAIVLYVIADFIVFWHTGGEPSSLTISFFAVCGGENGFMAWIRTRKQEERYREWQKIDEEKPDEYVKSEEL